MGFSSVFGAAKDRAAEMAAKSYLGRKIEGFGEVRAVQLDSRAKKIRLEVALKGEVSPVEIRIDQYEILQKGDDRYIVLRDVQASREWLGLAIQQYAIGQEFKLPAAVGSVL